MKNLTIGTLVFLGILALATPISAFTIYDISVGTDKLVYGVGDKAIISGYVKTSSGKPAIGIPVNVIVTYGSTQIYSNSGTTSSTGSYKFTDIPVDKSGTYNITVTVSSGGGVGYGSFKAESKKVYTLTTDKFTYSVSDTAIISLLVEEVSNGVKTPAEGVTVPIKIKLENGTVLKSMDLVTNQNGQANTTYTIPCYGKYTVVAGNGLAIAKFEAPPFNVKVDTLTSGDKVKHIFSSSDELVLRVVATIYTDNGAVPVTGATILATMKDADGNVKNMNFTFTEVSDGVYKSNSISLSNYGNGKYYVEVKVTKGSTQSTKIDFEIRTYRVDLVPFNEYGNTFGYLAGSDASVGIIVEDLSNGEELTGDKIVNAWIVECRNSEWEEVDIGSGELIDGMKDFAKILRFTAPSETDEYYLKVRVKISTTSGYVNVTGEVWISVQPVITSVENKDNFGNWRWKYSPGETVVLEVKAIGSGWNDVTDNIQSVTLQEVRDEDWNDVTSEFTDVSYSGNTVQFSAPKNSGRYSVKLLVTMKDGIEAYAGTDFEVALYDIWADTKKLDENENWQWEWRFGTDSDVYLHINVREMDGSVLPLNKIAKISVNSMINEVTGKKYTNLKVNTSYGTAKSYDGEDVPVVKLSLNGMGLSSGFYSVEFEVTDTEGNKETGMAWFKVSNLDVFTQTKKSSGEFSWQFGPSDNITIEVTAQYFNMTPVPDGSTVTITKLMSMREGPPTLISSSKYTTSGTATTNNGQATLWLKPIGDPLPQGHYMALIEVVANDAENTEELAEAWFDISVMKVEVSSQSYFSQNQNVSFAITVKKSDGTPLEGASVTLDELRDTMTWNMLNLDELGISATGTTDAQGRTTLEFPAENLAAGEYEARILVESDTLNAKSESFIWFSIQNYKIEGWFVTDPGREYGVYAPDEEVTMQIKVLYPNSTWSQEYPVENADVTVDQLVNTETIPWTFKDASMVSSTPTAMPGVYQVKFKAPKESGKYHPLVNISGDVSKDPWLLPEFTVRDLAISVTTYRSDIQTDEFMPGDTITTKIDIANPTGNELPSISEVKLEYYKNLYTDEMTQLGGKITSNIGESNTLEFTAPDTEGEYILTVSVKTSNKTIYADKWFRVSSFELEAWTERWSYSPGDEINVNIKAYSVAGTTDVNVSTIAIRDVWGSSYVVYSENGTDEQVIPGGEGIYKLTAPDEIGEYEARLCIYEDDAGQLCENGKEVYVHFSVESFRIDSWPENGGSFTTEEDVGLNVQLWNSDGSRVSVNDFNVTLNGVVKAMTQEDVTALVGNVSYEVSDFDPNYVKVVRFSAANLDEGEYEAILNITHGDESRIWRSWFRISSFSIYLQTEPPEYNPWDHPFPANENITFNVTLIPAQDDVSGTLYIKDCIKNWEDAVNPINLEFDNGTAMVNVSLNAGEYEAVAIVENAEQHYWFKVSSFNFNIYHEQSTHEIKPGDSVEIKFQLLNNTGGAEYSSVNINVTRIRNAMTWETVVENVYSGSVSLDSNGEGTLIFDPGNLGGGEYEAELEISVDGKTQTEYFWFQIRTLIFDVWHDGTFLPGETITLNVELRNPDGTPIQGTDISVTEVHSMMMGEITNYISTSGTTDSNGRATITLTLPSDVTGWVDVALQESGNNEIRWVGLNINGFTINLNRNWEKWAFSINENYTADVYVYDADGIPASNKPVKIEVFKEGEWETPCYTANMPDTDSDGHTEVNFSLAELDGTGQYELQIIVADGAAIERDWFTVESFHVEAWVQGSDSGREELTPSEYVRVMVKVSELGTWNPISGANVTLMELHPIPEWTPIDFPNVTKNDQTTDSNGFAELMFEAPSEGEYEVWINVTHPSFGTNIGHAWFRVTSALITHRMLCPIVDGQEVSCRDPYIKTPGGPVNIEVEGSGELKVVLTGINDFWRNERISANATATGVNSTILNFTAPEQEGSYEAIFEIYVKKDGIWEFIGEEREWFEVIPSSGLMAHTWVDPQNVWIGKNATVMINIEDFETWQPIECEEGSNMYITEIKDSWSWTTVVNGDELEQYYEPPSDIGPMESRITFKVPELETGREYAAMISITCVHDGQSEDLGTKEAWFRVAAFQVSTLMDEFQEVNKTVYYWIKVTDAEGNPIPNATVYQEKLIGEPNWEPIYTWTDVSYTTDENGEVIGSFQTPSYPGNFELEYTIVNGTTSQKMQRWFQVKGMDVKIELEKPRFYVGEGINITVNVTDSVTGLPVEGATVRLQILPEMVVPPEMEEQNETGSEEVFIEPIFFPETTTDSNGIAEFFIPPENTTSAEYSIVADICKDDKGCMFSEKRFKVSYFNISTTLGREYEPGDNITITLTGKDKNDQYLANATVLANLVGVSIESSNMTVLAEKEVMLDDTGTASFNLTIPENASGMSMVMISVNYSGQVDTEGYLVVIHQPDALINVTANGTAAPGEFIDVYINSTNLNLSVAPIVIHMARIGSSVSMSQMVGGKMSEDFYESPIYLRKDGENTHIKILARKQPGSYTAVLMFTGQESSWYGPEDMQSVVFVDYEVVE